MDYFSARQVAEHAGCAKVTVVDIARRLAIGQKNSFGFWLFSPAEAEKIAAALRPSAGNPQFGADFWPRQKKKSRRKPKRG